MDGTLLHNNVGHTLFIFAQRESNGFPCNYLGFLCCSLTVFLCRYFLSKPTALCKGVRMVQYQFLVIISWRKMKRYDSIYSYR